MTRSPLFALFLAAVFTTLGCEPIPNPTPPIQKAETEVLTEELVEVVPGRADFDRILPAFELDSESKGPGKADQAWDYKIANPQWFAITEPPQTNNYRAMVEWEPMDKLFINYTNGMVSDWLVGKTLADIATHTIETRWTSSGRHPIVGVAARSCDGAGGCMGRRA